MRLYIYIFTYLFLLINVAVLNAQSEDEVVRPGQSVLNWQSQGTYVYLFPSGSAQWLSYADTLNSDKTNPEDIIKGWRNTLTTLKIKSVVLCLTDSAGNYNNLPLIWLSENDYRKTRLKEWFNAYIRIMHEGNIKVGFFLPYSSRNFNFTNELPPDLFMRFAYDFMSNVDKPDFFRTEPVNPFIRVKKRSVESIQPLYERLKKLNPELIISGLMGPDLRIIQSPPTVGKEEYWPAIDPYATAYGREIYLSQEKGDPYGKIFAPGECLAKMPFSPESSTIDTIWILADMMRTYRNTVGKGMNLAWSLTLDAAFRIPSYDSIAIQRQIRYLAELQKKNFAEDAKVTCPFDGGIPADKGKLAFLTDGFLETTWRPDSFSNFTILDIDLVKNATFNYIQLNEDISYGQRIMSFEIFSKDNDGFESLFKGRTIGYNKLIKLKKNTCGRLRIIIYASIGKPALKELKLFYKKDLPQSPIIARDKNGWVTLSSYSTESFIYYTIDGDNPGQDDIMYEGPFRLKSGGTVKAISISDDGEMKSSVKKRSFDWMKGLWKVDVSGDYVSDHKPKFLTDNSAKTYWASNSGKKGKGYPHTIHLDLTDTFAVKGMVLTLASAPKKKGRIKNIEIKGSEDGKTWFELVDVTSIASLKPKGTVVKVPFKKKHTLRYVKITATAPANKKDRSAALAEISIY